MWERGKGKGEGKSKSSFELPPGYNRSTPDVCKICFKYNPPSASCAGSCGFVHVCQIRFQKRPARYCPSSMANKEGKD